MMSAKYGFLGVVRAILAAHASLHRADTRGCTAMHLTVSPAGLAMPGGGSRHMRDSLN